MTKQAITVTDNEILICSEYFTSKDNACLNKEWLLDVMSVHYRDQAIRISAADGENLKASGFLQFFEELCNSFNIETNQVVVETHDTSLTAPFDFVHLPLGLFLGANKFIADFERDFSQSKFVGAVIGRFTPTRLRLAYELDRAFANDNYLVFQSRTWWYHEPFMDLYRKEWEWFQQRKFDQDMRGSASGAVDPIEAYRHYHQVWNNYFIEVIAETDPVSDFWFTEKTGKCLASGKPFLLLNGKGSLARIKSFGFETFDTVIDESYDQEPTPTQRIMAIVNSLQILYNSPNKLEKIAELYNIAERNQEHYKKYVTSQGHDV